MRNNARRGVLALLWLAFVLLAPTQAGATCLWEPPPGELFTVPADGAADVPAHARLWVLLGLEPGSTVSMDGVELDGVKEGLAWRSYQLPELVPGQTYTYTVTICHVEGCDQTFDYGPYSFTVGEAEAAPPALPVLQEGAASTTEGINWVPAGDGSCLDQVMEQDCYDVGPLAYYQMTLEPNPGASHYAVWTGEKKAGSLYFSTADCPVQIISHCTPPEDRDECDPQSAGACFNVAAYNEAGQSTEPVELCINGSTENEGESGSGCGFSASPSAFAGWLLLALLATLAFLGMRKEEATRTSPVP